MEKIYQAGMFIVVTENYENVNYGFLGREKGGKLELLTFHYFYNDNELLGATPLMHERAGVLRVLSQEADELDRHYKLSPERTEEYLADLKRGVISDQFKHCESAGPFAIIEINEGPYVQYGVFVCETLKGDPIQKFNAVWMGKTVHSQDDENYEGRHKQEAKEWLDSWEKILKSDPSIRELVREQKAKFKFGFDELQLSLFMFGSSMKDFDKHRKARIEGALKDTSNC